MLNKSKSEGNCIIEKKRGFKPSDRHDPQKKKFLVQLSKQIWQKDESTTQKQIDLQKIFTPAEDAEYISPKNRKLYASSAFYAQGLHPTVEDQVELARRISHSLSDISNQQSKGQSMYVNRKKRSVKWVHEGQGHDYQQQQQPHCQGGGVPYKAPTSPNLLPAYSEAGKHRVQLNLHQEQLLQKYVKPELRVVKTPWEAALETGSASTAFVEAPQQRSSPYLSQQQQQQQQRARSMTPMPTHTMQQQQQLAQQPKPYQPTKQYQPQQQQQQQQQQSQNQYPEPTFDSHFKLPKANQNQQPMKYCSNYQRDLAYKPSVPQGWKSSSVNLPTELYVPREIPLESYKPPPPMPTVLNTPTPTFPSSNTWSPMKSLPKQQFVPQKSYEPVKTLPTSPPMGGVNYTPAPLNQQKLEPWSKFPTSNSSPTNRYSGPSFNNAARGWQKGAHPMVNTKAYAPPRPTVEHRGWKVPEQLPYTDF